MKLRKHYSSSTSEGHQYCSLSCILKTPYGHQKALATDYYLPLCLFAFIFLIHSYILILMNRIVPDPYMDEIFHIPQAQSVCNGDHSSFDPHITTLPGIYFIAWFCRNIIYLLSFNSTWMSSLYSCPTSFLRSINAIIFGPMTVPISWLLLIQIHGKSHSSICAMRLLRILTLPAHFFFNFLFYTESSSTFFVLTMYYFALKGENKISSLFGLIAICIRQTNVVWLFGSTIITLWNSYPQPPFGIINCLIAVVIDQRISKINKVHRLIKIVIEIIKRLYVQLIIFLCFSVFFFLNDFNVVVGNKQFHEPTLHLMQIIYLCTYLAVVSGINNFAKFARNVALLLYKLSYYCRIKESNSNNLLVESESAMSSLYCILSYLALCFICSYFGFKIHQYILSDSRHFPFYVFIALRKWPILLVILSVFVATFFALSDIGQHITIPFRYVNNFEKIKNLIEMQEPNNPSSNNEIDKQLMHSMQYNNCAAFAKLRASKIYIITFWLCASFVLVPTGLFEIRYFMIPILLFLFHQDLTKSSGNYCWILPFSNELLCTVVHCIINIILFYIFLFLPYHSEFEENSRLMF